MTRFEDKLELELEAVVADNPPPAPARRRFGWKPRVALVGALATAATAIAVSGVVQPTNPAWAVEKTGDGTVKVKFHELEDPEGLEKALAKVGLRVDITFLPTGKGCKDPLGKDDPDGPVDLGVDAEGPRASSYTIEFRYRPQRPDQTATITLAGTTAEHSSGGFAIDFRNILGPVAPCELVDASADNFEVFTR